MTHVVHEAGAPLVSIVIVNYNGLGFADQCVRSVLRSEYPNFEVVLVDNASTDGSYEDLSRSFGGIPKVRILHNSRNVGYAEGNNYGYKQASGEIVAFLNIDTCVEANWLNELVGAMIADSAVGAAQSKLLSMDDPPKVDSLGSYLDALGYVYSWGEWYSARPHEIPDEPFFAEGAAMAVRRWAVDQVLVEGRPFDADYFFYYEDSDLSWRMRLRGFKVILASHSVVYHHRGYATQQRLHVAVFNSAKNRISTLVKNYGLLNLSRRIPLLVILELLRAVVFLREEPRSAYAKLAAILWCLRNLRRIWKRRALVQFCIRKRPDSEIVKMMLRPNFATLFRSVRVPLERP